MKMRPVICNKCGNEFKIKKTKKKLVKDGLEGQVSIHYFVCLKCETRYTYFVENEELSKLIKRKKKVYSGIRHMKDVKEIESAFKEFEDLDKKVTALHNRLKIKFKA